MHVAAQEAFGVAAVRQAFQRGKQGRIEGFAGGRVVDGAAVDLGGAGAVVEGLGAAFDLQRVHAELRQTLHVLDGAQIMEFMI